MIYQFKWHTSGSYVILKTSTMSPRNLLYFRVGRFMRWSLSVYDMFLKVYYQFGCSFLNLFNFFYVPYLVRAPDRVSVKVTQVTSKCRFTSEELHYNITTGPQNSYSSRSTTARLIYRARKFDHVTPLLSGNSTGCLFLNGLLLSWPHWYFGAFMASRQLTLPKLLNISSKFFHHIG